MNWRISFYSPALEREILDLPAGFVAGFLRYAERMEVYGPDLANRELRIARKRMKEVKDAEQS